MKNAIVIGASSGIGRELAKILSQQGYRVGIAARRLPLLYSLKDELPNNTVVQQMDICQPETIPAALNKMIRVMDNSISLVIVCAGSGELNHELDWALEQSTIQTNVIGFSAVANVAIKHFLSEKTGHLVGISSIAAIRGGKASPAYNASKAFMSNYLQGLRQKVGHEKLDITVTDIKPGFVDTDMAKGNGLFWVAPPEKAARQIMNAITRKKQHAYITKRWRIIAWLLKTIPESIYCRL